MGAVMARNNVEDKGDYLKKCGQRFLGVLFRVMKTFTPTIIEPLGAQSQRAQ